MLFNTLDFALFLPIVFCVFWLFKDKLRTQNIIILIASYVFYGWWDYRFLGLIFISTLVDFIIGHFLTNEKVQIKRKLLLGVSITVNLGLLGFFKYYNFFLESFNEAFSVLGYGFGAQSLAIILPVGISFYTFQTLSYSIDIYRGNLKGSKDFISFAAFVSFFPQLVAGPIERASNLLPQFEKKRVFDSSKAVDGMRQILWGLVKKVVIADTCAEHVNYIFTNSAELNGSTLLLGALLFTFQIYGDFSGYSDIAIGTARLFGFDLMKNFSFPYFSRDIAEFWRRWHISLSTWFRDYLYIPLGGSRGSTYKKVRNVFIIFIVSGFWHGANWTFIVWGALNALYFLPLLLLNRNRNNTGLIAEGRILPTAKEVLGISTTFGLTVLAWVFFRSADLTQAFQILSEIFSTSLFMIPEVLPIGVIVLVVLFIVSEWFGRSYEFALQKIQLVPNTFLRWLVYSLIALLIIANFDNKQDFIYFQF